jgi:cytochrome c biogenesis protein CcmG, thiol:disulfide interchange protein DsbE
MQTLRDSQETRRPNSPGSPRRPKKLLPAVVGLVIAGFGLIVAGGASWFLFSGPTSVDATPPTDFSAIPARVAYDAPSLELKDTQGVPHTLSEYRGQVILINLWATWCPPCAAEMPNLQRFYEGHRREGFVVIGVEDGDAAPEVVAFVTARGLTFPIWLDLTYQATDKVFKTSNLPSSYVVDRGGKIRLVWFGAISHANLEKYVAPLIKE